MSGVQSAAQKTLSGLLCGALLFIPFQHFWTFHEAINHSGLDRLYWLQHTGRVRHNPDSFRVVALVAGKNVARMAEQCLEFSPRYAVMDDTSSAEQLKIMLSSMAAAPRF
ncbi:1-deoxy-D-xylulose 5-phosphate reductoisomerase [Salmonella enterica subsp. arizonae]|uniref:1-deoxy-D-xylulose 5-phosphate reductoisomerase n=1 Tax=Salmonella enterica subsp. arizonae TaxID=59203 RepID=A0A447R967_SALER|nr:1-deoxy-D-xylulose 5-phosphate reductoisomerase [Salmonella enterica subsp. arizonae]